MIYFCPKCNTQHNENTLCHNDVIINRTCPPNCPGNIPDRWRDVREKIEERKLEMTIRKGGEKYVRALEWVLTLFPPANETDDTNNAVTELVECYQVRDELLKAIDLAYSFCKEYRTDGAARILQEAFNKAVNEKNGGKE